MLPHGFSIHVMAKIDLLIILKCSLKSLISFSILGQYYYIVASVSKAQMFRGFFFQSIDLFILKEIIILYASRLITNLKLYSIP